MRHIGDVVCAIIENDGEFLIAQRPSGHHLEGKWEFPGGKVVPGEKPESAIRREVQEELNVVIEIISPLTPNEHAYKRIALRLIPYRCRIISGYLSPVEHANIAWVDERTIERYELSGADISILEEYLKQRTLR